MPPRPPRAALQQRDIPMEPSTIQKKKLRAEAIKAAREKYSNLSRATLPPPTTTVPVDRPTAPTGRLRPPSASALPLFRSDPAAAAPIRDGPQIAPAVRSRPSVVPRPSLVSLAPRPSIVPRSSVAPRPSLMARPQLAPRPSMLPRDPDAPFALNHGPIPFNTSASSSSSGGTGSSSSSVPFEVVGESLSRIMRNEPLPMASGARASSIARRNMPRPSMVPGGINIFTATGADRLEAERLQAASTPRRLRGTRGDESVHRSRVRFEVESIIEQRESVGDEVDETPASSAATSSLSTLTLQSSLRREHSTLGPFPPSTRAPPPSLGDPPRSILKQRKSPRGIAPSSSSSTSVAIASSSSSILANPIVETTAGTDENQPTRETPSRNRATPTRNESAKKKKKKMGMMDVYAALSAMVDDDDVRKETPSVMITDCIKLLKKMEQKKREENKDEEDDTEEEESELDMGIRVEEEEEEEGEETMSLPPCELTLNRTTPRRRSSRLASSQGVVARSLFTD